jgi:hypothetical protein
VEEYEKKGDRDDEDERRGRKLRVERKKEDSTKRSQRTQSAPSRRDTAERRPAERTDGSGVENSRPMVPQLSKLSIPFIVLVFLKKAHPFEYAGKRKKTQG